MKFPAWVDGQGRGILTLLFRRTGIGYQTILKANRGEPLASYDLARRLSEATGGAVTVQELCEPDAHESSEDHGDSRNAYAREQKPSGTDG